MTFYTYILKSFVADRIYIGHTGNLKRRLHEHNSGKTKSTKAFAPWEIIHIEEFHTRADAIQCEKYFKSGSGREKIKANYL